MELAHLKTFLLAAELQTFTQAAKRQSYSQSAVSQQIRDLEQALGVKLFERHPRSVSLTPAGECLRQAATSILAEVDEAVNALAAFGKGPQGICRIGVATSNAGLDLPAKLAAAARSFPGVRLRVHAGRAKDLLESFEDGDLDAVLLDARPPARVAKGKVVMALLEDRVVAVANADLAGLRGKTFALQDLAHLPIVAWTPEAAIREVVDTALDRAGFDPSHLGVLLELGDAESIKRVVVASPAIAFLPASACGRELAEGSLVALSLPKFQAVFSHWLLHSGTGPCGLIAEALAVGTAGGQGSVRTLTA